MGNLVGAETYKYLSNGWNVTMTFPVTLNPTYTVTARYTSPISQITPERIIVDWAGNWASANGVITEKSFSFTP